MSEAQLAAVSFLARYAGHTHGLYAFKLRQRSTLHSDLAAQSESRSGTAE